MTTLHKRAAWLPILALLILILSACQTTPEPTAPGDTEGGNHEITLNGETISYEVIDGLAIFEGDIILGTVEELERRALESQAVFHDRHCNRFWCSGKDYRWPDGEVPFFIGDSVDRPTGEQQIRQAIAHWEANTPIRFVELDSPLVFGRDYVLFLAGSRDDACSSSVGRQGGLQTILLTSDGTCSRGSLIHEIGHAMGLWHEQSRADRNDFVRIVWDNIDSDDRGNFKKHKRDGVDIGRYDYSSIMHYGAFAFCREDSSENCVGPTIETIPPGIPIGQRSGLSDGDVAAIGALYGHPGEQRKPVVAADADGNFVLVWEDDRDGNGQYQILAQGFRADGSVRFDTVTVNSVSWNQQLRPAVAMNEDGSFVVVWEDDRDGNGEYQIFARGFHANGSARFRDITVNSISWRQQRRPDVAMDASGDFVVVWEDDRDGNGFYDVMARGFHAGGAVRFNDITVNTARSGQQRRPAVAVDDDGEFVVVWEDDKDGNGLYQILARGFWASGRQRFADRTVNTASSGQQLRPDIAMDAVGHFVVVWEDDKDGNGKYQILARGFWGSGSQRFADMTVNSASSGQQRRPAIAMNAAGNFVVTWQDDKDENGKYQIFARGFWASGRERFADITVNTVSNGQQRRPDVAMSGGAFVVSWEDGKPSNDHRDAMARRFGKRGNPIFVDVTAR